MENTIPGILLVKCYVDHRPLAIKPFATSSTTQAFQVLCQGLTILGSDAKKSQQGFLAPLLGNGSWSTRLKVIKLSLFD